jgi:uncharacterized protein
MMVEIDYLALEEETLLNLLKEIILREGTDYGADDLSFEAKLCHIKKNLHTKKARIVYLPDEEYCDVVPV